MIASSLKVGRKPRIRWCVGSFKSIRKAWAEKEHGVTYYIIARSAHACDWFLPSLSKIFHSNRKIPFSLCIQNLRMMRIYKGSLIELSLRLLLLPKTRTRLICWKPVCLGTLSFQWTYLPGTDSTLRALPSFLIPSLWPPKIQLLIAISIF